MQTDSCVVPIAGLLANNSQFLELLASNADAKCFCNTIALVAVQHKWESFGRSFFHARLVLYLLGLVSVNAFVLLKSAATTWPMEGGSHDAAVVLLVLLTALAVISALAEGYQALRGAPGVVAYMQDLFNFIECTQITLTFAATVHFYYPSNGEAAAKAGLDMSVSLLVYVKWIGLYSHLQFVPHIGPVVRMDGANLRRHPRGTTHLIYCDDCLRCCNGVTT